MKITGFWVKKLRSSVEQKRYEETELSENQNHSELHTYWRGGGRARSDLNLLCETKIFKWRLKECEDPRHCRRRRSKWFRADFWWPWFVESQDGIIKATRGRGVEDEAVIHFEFEGGSSRPPPRDCGVAVGPTTHTCPPPWQCNIFLPQQMVAH